MDAGHTLYEQGLLVSYQFLTWLLKSDSLSSISGTLHTVFVIFCFPQDVATHACSDHNPGTEVDDMGWT